MYMNQFDLSLMDEKILCEIFDHLDDGVLLIDKDGNILFYNSTWYNLCQPAESAIVPAKNVYEFYDLGAWGTVSSIEVLKTKKYSVNLCKTISGQIVVSQGLPIFDDGGRLIYVLAKVRNISASSKLHDIFTQSDRIKKQYINCMKETEQRSTDDPIYTDPKMVAIYEKCLFIRDVDATVLIQGESGVGKDVLARFIHKNSTRKDGPYLSINVSAIPESLLESELFGYEAGAFTGANRKGKIGIFEAANGGTLLLDEMGELPLNMQVKLLRVLENRQITHVGGTKPVDIDVRIIVATNRDLSARVKSGMFRGDLYYRINVINITIPPLRERPADIISLANHFLNVFNIQYHRQCIISEGLYGRLAEYDWPGNVRGLRNIVEQMVIFASSGDIAKETFDELIPLQEGEKKTVSVQKLSNMGEVVAETERQLLVLALKSPHPTTRSIAQLLGISQTSVVRKLKQYGLAIPEIETN